MENEFDLFSGFIGKQISVIKNDSTKIIGTLLSIDGYLNIVLSDAKFMSESEMTIKRIFIRGSVIDYISK